MSGSYQPTAIILAGGKSSRMKTDKGLVFFNGKMLVQHVIESLKKITGSIIIISGNPAYKQFGYPCIEDELKDRGPLGGIYTGLVHSISKKNLFVGCDMPFLSERLLKKLINKCGEEDVLLAGYAGQAEPLCSVYDKNCMAHIRSLLEQNQLKITTALEGLKIRVVSFDNEPWFEGNEFANINSIDELNKYKG
ncbi:MAG TPA: molybdenum cofactor guanylyltransferase [Chitinophagaceae bacterium]|nr:molybdenum cofactor guanylyltransferase [Chitinophagaceae bacterium]